MQQMAHCQQVGKIVYHARMLFLSGPISSDEIVRIKNALVVGLLVTEKEQLHNLLKQMFLLLAWSLFRE